MPILGEILGYWRQVHVQENGQEVVLNIVTPLRQYDRLIINGGEVPIPGSNDEQRRELSDGRTAAVARATLTSAYRACAPAYDSFRFCYVAAPCGTRPGAQTLIHVIALDGAFDELPDEIRHLGP